MWVLNTCYPDNGTTGWWVTWKVAPTRVGLGFAVRSDQRGSEGIRGDQRVGLSEHLPRITCNMFLYLYIRISI